MFGRKRYALDVVEESCSGGSSPQEALAAQFLRVSEVSKDVHHNIAPYMYPRPAPDGIPVEVWNVVVRRFDNDEQYGAQVVLQTVSLCNKYRLSADEMASAVLLAYRVTVRLPQLRQALAPAS